MSRHDLQPGGFEHDSHRFLTARGHALRRTDAGMLRERHLAWNHVLFRDGYLNPVGGWVESGRVIARLAAEARAVGVEIVENAGAARPEFAAGRCIGITAESGSWKADRVLLAAGAWTPELLPELEAVMWATAQTVVHFQPQDARPYTPPAFPVWGADIGKTGWYGFPANAAGLVKVANHGPGRRVSAAEARVWPEGEEQRYRDFPILTAQPSAAERARAPHRLLGDLDAQVVSTAADWAAKAAAEILEAHAAQRLPIVVGGTGLWLRALLRGLMELPPVDLALRARLDAETDELGAAAVVDRMHVKNLHATILSQLGLDPNALSFRYQGLDQKLVGVEGATPIPGIA
jgi:hypothetical protein